MGERVKGLWCTVLAVAVANRDRPGLDTNERGEPPASSPPSLLTSEATSPTVAAGYGPRRSSRMVLRAADFMWMAGRTVCASHFFAAFFAAATPTRFSVGWGGGSGRGYGGGIGVSPFTTSWRSSANLMAGLALVGALENAILSNSAAAPFLAPFVASSLAWITGDPGSDSADASNAP